MFKQVKVFLLKLSFYCSPRLETERQEEVRLKSPQPEESISSLLIIDVSHTVKKKGGFCFRTRRVMDSLSHRKTGSCLDSFTSVDSAVISFQCWRWPAVTSQAVRALLPSFVSLAPPTSLPPSICEIALFQQADWMRTWFTVVNKVSRSGWRRLVPLQDNYNPVAATATLSPIPPSQHTHS